MPLELEKFELAASTLIKVLLNAISPIEVTEAGIVIVVKPVQPLKA